MDKRLEHLSTTRYQKSQVTLAVTLWLSGVVIDQTFTLRGLDVCTRLFVDHRRVNVFIHMLRFYGWSQPRNCFNNKIFSMYSSWAFTASSVCNWEQSC